MIRKMSSTAMLFVVTALGAGAVAAEPAGGLDWSQQRVAAAQQTAAENAYRWEQQERQRIQQQHLEARQAAEDAKQRRLRERTRERSQDRTGFSASGSNSGGMGGARMGGGKGGH